MKSLLFIFTFLIAAVFQVALAEVDEVKQPDTFVNDAKAAISTSDLIAKADRRAQKNDEELAYLILNYIESEDYTHMHSALVESVGEEYNGPLGNALFQFKQVQEREKWKYRMKMRGMHDIEKDKMTADLYRQAMHTFERKKIAIREKYNALDKERTEKYKALQIEKNSIKTSRMLAKNRNARLTKINIELKNLEEESPEAKQLEEEHKKVIKKINTFDRVITDLHNDIDGQIASIQKRRQEKPSHTVYRKNKYDALVGSVEKFNQEGIELERATANMQQKRNKLMRAKKALAKFASDFDEDFKKKDGNTDGFSEAEEEELAEIREDIHSAFDGIKIMQEGLSEMEKGEAEQNLIAFLDDLLSGEDMLRPQKSPELTVAEVVIKSAFNNEIFDRKTKKFNLKMALMDLKVLAKELKDDHGVLIDVKASQLKTMFATDQMVLDRFNNTPMGAYVNSQIANAMGSVCSYRSMCSLGMDNNGIVPEIVNQSFIDLNDKTRADKNYQSFAIGEKPKSNTTVVAD